MGYSEGSDYEKMSCHQRLVWRDGKTSSTRIFI